MNCIECDKEMKLVACGDTGGGGLNDTNDQDYATNIYWCMGCLVLLREHVWSNRGRVWLMPESNEPIVVEKREGGE